LLCDTTYALTSGRGAYIFFNTLTAAAALSHPDDFSRMSAMPNPMFEKTTIRYSLDKKHTCPWWLLTWQEEKLFN